MFFAMHKFLGWLVLCPLLVACASTDVQLKGADLYLSQGKIALEKGQCLKAIEHFRRIVNNFPGSSMIADAQYYLANSYFCNEDYVEAVFEYQRLVDIYPSSPWLDEAQFQIAESYYLQLRRPELDQRETREALTHFRQFIDDNTGSPLVAKARDRIVDCRSRLAAKVYQAARLYHKQNYPVAARLTYNDLILNYPDTPWYFEGVYRLGELALAAGDVAGARRFFDEIVAEVTVDDGLRERVRRSVAELEVTEVE